MLSWLQYDNRENITTGLNGFMTAIEHGTDEKGTSDTTFVYRTDGEKA